MASSDEGCRDADCGWCILQVPHGEWDALRKKYHEEYLVIARSVHHHVLLEDLNVIIKRIWFSDKYREFGKGSSFHILTVVDR